jgi:hypothetical protein
MVTLMGGASSNWGETLPIKHSPRERRRERLAVANLVAVLAACLATSVFPLIPLVAYIVVMTLAFALFVASGAAYRSSRES